MSEQYIYQVARVRCRELSLLTKQDIDAVLATKDYNSSLRYLFDKGLGTGTETTIEAVLQEENRKLWDFIDELLKDKSAFKVLMLPADYNNLKAAIKSSVSKQAHSSIYKDGGTIEATIIEEAIKLNDFSKLPKEMQTCATKAYKDFLQSRDGQLCDIFIDKCCLEHILDSAKDEELLRDYADLTVTLANIKTAVRCNKTGKNLDFIKSALVKTGLMDENALAVSATKSWDDLMGFLSNSKFSDSVEKLNISNSAFEKYCDDKVMDLVKKQKVNPFGIGPIVAYVIARQTELNSIKIILSAKLNELDSESIKERLREMYV